MAREKKDFEPDERDVLKLILNDIYRRLEFDNDKDMYIDSKSDIELTSEEYIVLQGILEKLGVAIY